VVFDNPQFIDYFRAATPVNETSALNIGSRPAKRREGGVESLRAIPWVFAWTQTRFHLPVWLGVGAALRSEADSGNEAIVQEMTTKWPFFNSMLNLMEMVLVKADLRIAARYDEKLVPVHLLALGEALRAELAATIAVILRLRQRTHLLADDPISLRQIGARHPYIDALNLLQVDTLQTIRRAPQTHQDDPILQDTLMVTIQGIAAGMQNTG